MVQLFTNSLKESVILDFFDQFKKYFYALFSVNRIELCVYTNAQTIVSMLYNFNFVYNKHHIV